MKYESNILKRLIDTYGVVGTPRYISEIIKEFIVRGKERFPELFTYQADWLAHIDEFGLNTTYTVSYTGQSIYAPNTLERPVKSAILKGSTKYRDIDTGEFLETFEEGRNLELVSVKMPVLTTTGKNLFKGFTKYDYTVDKHVTIKEITNDSLLYSTSAWDTSIVFYIPINGGKSYITSANTTNVIADDFYFVDELKQIIGTEFSLNKSVTSPINAKFIKWHVRNSNTNVDCLISNFQLEESTSLTSYEPYKTNILTVNEDVTLRSNGDIYDELNLLTGQLTQRIDEDGEILTQEVVKTVDLSILNQNGQNDKQLMSFKGGTHFNTRSSEGSPLPSVSVSVETDLEETLLECSLEGNTI